MIPRILFRLIFSFLLVSLLRAVERRFGVTGLLIIMVVLVLLPIAARIILLR